MPDIKLWHPETLSLDKAASDRLIATLRRVVASHLSYHDYYGHLRTVAPGEGDVYLLPYSLRGSKLCAVYMLEITGYDSPGRMGNIGDRISGICSELADALPGFQLNSVEKRVSAMYYPIPEGCWASA